MDRATLRQMAMAALSQVGIQLDEANVKAEIDDNWFLGGLEPTNQLYIVHFLVDGQGREEPGRHGWVEFNWKGEVQSWELLEQDEYGKQEIASSNDGIEYDRMNPPIRKPMPIRYRPLLPPASPTP
ncbi:hypothetical protein [Microcoleus sp.]|uniref:hypothetical protein n=1 Tax=Microcoleus sp. TaxID=44472 RepID=UPI00352464C6